MATNDLSNKENIVISYFQEMARAEFPNVDLGEHSAFMEMFGVPHVKLLTPLLEAADRIKLTQSLDNAELMTDEEMDELAAGHFFYRQPGEYAVGYVTISFDDIPANGTIQIPAGTEVESNSGLRFRATETTVLNEEDLANYYDPDLFLYSIPVFFEAVNPGESYNVIENEITQMISALANVASVTNEVRFIGGKDRETNAELAQRIRDTAGTPNVGVVRGWRRFLTSFPNVEDVLIAGFGHPLMKRDIVGTTPPGRFSSNANPQVHWGGKIDLHIRGERLADHVESLVIEKDENGDLIVPLEKHPTHDILEITFSSPRYTDPDLDPSFFVVRDFVLMREEDTETLGTLYEKSWVVLKDDRLMETDIVIVRYRYNALFEDINNALYLEDNRPPASDVLLKQARRKYIHSAMVIKLETVVGIKERDRSIIRQRLFNYIDSLPMGGEVQFSDFTEPIYRVEEDSIDTAVDYINLPSQFIVTDYDNKHLYYCLNEEKRDFLKTLQKESTYFSQLIPSYSDVVTIYDFFDILHTLTYQNLSKNAWKDLSFQNNEWGKKTYYLDLCKRMLAYTNSIQRLSPARWVSSENDYFQLGNLSIYEDVPYTPSDLENWVNLFESIANSGQEEEIDENLLHLTVYVCVMIYILTAENIGTLTVDDIFTWLIDLTKGTPIDYQVHN
jgi:hypothetical protein